MSVLLPELATKLNWHFTSGSEFLWRCWGDSCRFADFSYRGWFVSAIFDTDTAEVLEINAHLENNREDTQQPWRWVADHALEAYLEEHVARGIDPWLAWDDVACRRLETKQELWAAIMEIHGG